MAADMSKIPLPPPGCELTDGDVMKLKIFIAACGRGETAADQHVVDLLRSLVRDLIPYYRDVSKWISSLDENDDEYVSSLQDKLERAKLKVKSQNDEISRLCAEISGRDKAINSLIAALSAFSSTGFVYLSDGQRSCLTSALGIR